MRCLAALVLAAVLAAPARPDSGAAATVRFDHGAEVSSGLSGGGLGLAAFLLPMAYAYALPHYGFGPFPYAAGGYGRGGRPMAFSAAVSEERARGERAAEHWLARVRGAERLGWDVGASAFQRGLLAPQRRAALVSGHVTSNYVQGPRQFLDLGLGFATYQDPAALWGPSMELDWELFPRRPWSVTARAQSALLRGQGYHSLSVSAGLVWRWVGVSAGYRLFLSPRGNVAGPELAAGGWF